MAAARSTPRLEPSSLNHYFTPSFEALIDPLTCSWEEILIVMLDPNPLTQTETIYPFIYETVTIIILQQGRTLQYITW